MTAAASQDNVINVDAKTLRLANIRPANGKDVLTAFALVILTALVLSDAWISIAQIAWAHEEQGYVLLAPMMVAWLLYIRKEEFAACRARGGWLGLLILAAGLFVYWYGFNVDPVLWRAGAVLAVVGAAVTAVGRDVFYRFLPAFAACVFFIPISPNGRYRLAVPLQEATAHATQTACDLLGIDVDRAGSVLSINGVDVQVAEACNGMRMVITLFLVCYVVAVTVPLRWWIRVLFLAASPIVAIVCNVVRLVPTVWLFGNYSHATAELFHDISGWGMSLVAFFILLGFCWVLQRMTSPGTPASAKEGTKT